MKQCSPEDMVLKSFFLGPQAENADFIKTEVQTLLQSWIDWRRSCYPQDGPAISASEQFSSEYKAKLSSFHQEISSLSERFCHEIPKFSPRYIGHMFSELSLPALLGHMIATLHNPNNLSKECSKIGAEIERDAIWELFAMFGFATGKQGSVGHFTSGGTVANFESVIRAKKKWRTNLERNWNSNGSLMEVSHRLDFADLASATKITSFNRLSDIEMARMIEKKFSVEFNGPVLIVPASKHYSWEKAAGYFGLGRQGLRPIPLNKWGQMDIAYLRKELDTCVAKQIPVLSVVSICGTTELGTIDPIDEIQNILFEFEKKEGFHFWHHVDAAYGGFFATIRDANTPHIQEHTKKALSALSKVTSITIDPHKLGYVPYACGAFLCRRPQDYFTDLPSAPYLDFNCNLDLGPYTLEGSRSAAGATATYLTAKCIGLNENGYGKILLRTIDARARLRSALTAEQLPILFLETEPTNILCFSVGSENMTLSEVNARTQELIKVIGEKSEFFVSKTILGENFSELIKEFCHQNKIKADGTQLSVIRLTLMNPFMTSAHTHTQFIPEFASYLKGILSDHSSTGTFPDIPHS